MRQKKKFNPYVGRKNGLRPLTDREKKVEILKKFQFKPTKLFLEFTQKEEVVERLISVQRVYTKSLSTFVDVASVLGGQYQGLQVNVDGITAIRTKTTGRYLFKKS